MRGMRRFNKGIDWIDRESVYQIIAVMLLFIAQIVWWYLFGLGLADNAGRFFGFPAWFFYSVILGFVFFTTAIWAVFNYLSKKHGDIHDSST